MFYTGGANASYIQIANGSTGAGSGNGMIVGVDASGNGIVSVRGVFDYITSVAGVERMRITSGGNVGINTSSPSYTLDVNGTARFGSAIVASLGTGLVYSSGGTLTSTNPSDQRLKNNIQSISYGLDEILKLNPVTFNWIEDKINQGKQYGFIAQEVQKIMPDLVKNLGIKDYLGLDKEAIFTILVRAIQQLNDKIK
jgi:hypothetical protein